MPIAATSASSFFASYTMPSLIVHLMPPTHSAFAVLSFSLDPGQEALELAAFRLQHL